MNILIFGVTGMVGQSALRECLENEEVHEILAISRKGTLQQHEKLKQIEVENVANLSGIEHELKDYDACFFCLGISSAGMKEEAYREITYDLTLSVAKTLANVNPQMTFIYVSGSGTDSSEKGRTMWARVKGKTENDLLRLPFKAAYMFRPGIIIPVQGIKSKTKLYQTLYAILKPLNPLLLKSNAVLTSEQVGKAMIQVAKAGFVHPVIEARDLKRISS